jgi:hypothetical protein
MSISHLNELRAALAEVGWHVVAERLRGEDDVEGAAVWEVRRGDSGPVLLIDFARLDGMGEDIPLEQSYGSRYAAKATRVCIFGESIEAVNCG